MREIKSEWRKIGTIGVDAGLCWIGDPCYLLGENPAFSSWDDFLEKLEGLTGESYPTLASFPYEKGHEGLGVCVSSGFGDGSYEVWAKIVSESDRDKRVAEIRVIFIGDEDE